MEPVMLDRKTKIVRQHLKSHADLAPSVPSIPKFAKSRTEKKRKKAEDHIKKIKTHCGGFYFNQQIACILHM